MRIPILTIGAFASILTINSAFADTTSSTVTSKNYVDTKFQTKIPVSNLTVDGGQKTQIAVPDTLVLYPTTNAGEINEMGVFNSAFFADLLFPNKDITTMFWTDEYANMVPSVWAVRSVVDSKMDNVQSKRICAGWPDGTTVADATHTDANCWLWNLPD